MAGGNTRGAPRGRQNVETRNGVEDIRGGERRDGGTSDTTDRKSGEIGRAHV